MARGWESKAVEAQLEEKDVRGEDRAAFEELSPADRARRERLDALKLSRARTLEQLERAAAPAHRERLDALKLSRARTLEQLERAAAPAHREMLKRTLLALERDIAEVSEEAEARP